MKNILYFIFFFPLFVFSADNIDIKNYYEASYTLGFNEGQELLSKSYNINIPPFKQGLLDGYNDTVPESVEKTRNSITESYIDWAIAKSSSLFFNKPLGKKTVDTFSYFVGVDYGKDFKNKFYPFDPNSFILGFSDAITNKSASVFAEAKDLDSFYAQAEETRKQVNDTEVGKNFDQQKFNLQLKKGISYSYIKETTKNKKIMPTLKSTVTIEYTLSELSKNQIMLLNEPQTVTLPITELAEGIQIAIMSMKEGDRTIFNIPTVLLHTSKTINTSTTRSLFDVTLQKIYNDEKVQTKNTNLKKSSKKKK